MEPGRKLLMKLYSNGDEAIEPDMGERVRAIRQSTGMSAAEFQRWLNAKGIAVNYSTWMNYEKGYAMYWRTARQLCELFPMISMDYIYRNTKHSMKMMQQLQAIAKAHPDAAAPRQSEPA
jgi:DNA-binding XRE family transcriptional regulator